MEGGRIQYSGTAQELREKPELLHSAYLLRGAQTAPARRPALPAGETGAHMSVTGIEHVLVLSDDIERTREFYASVRSACGSATVRRCSSPATGCMPA